MTAPVVEPEVEVPAVAMAAVVRMLRLGVPEEALDEVATALELQVAEGRAGRVSLHIDSPPSGHPAGGVVEGIGGAQPFLCGRR